MPAAETRLLDARGLHGLLESLVAQIAGQRRADAPLCLVGIRSRGVPIAERLAALLEPLVGEPVRVGAVDVTLYRDDSHQRERWPVLRGTDIEFPVEGAEIVLVDDVFYTGRTARAALNAVCDLGRPARVALAAVVERAGRELPLRPDYVGTTVIAQPDERVLVRIEPGDPVEEIVRFGPNR
jgi:pyrimidine operon attenuation protein/uracil phosphoribosyltransferase